MPTLYELVKKAQLAEDSANAAMAAIFEHLSYSPPELLALAPTALQAISTARHAWEDVMSQSSFSTDPAVIQVYGSAQDHLSALDAAHAKLMDYVLHHAKFNIPAPPPPTTLPGPLPGLTPSPQPPPATGPLPSGAANPLTNFPTGLGTQPAGAQPAQPDGTQPGPPTSEEGPSIPWLWIAGGAALVSKLLGWW